MTLEDLEYETAGPVATITLARPDARNAYSEAMVRSLVKALDTAQQDAAVRAVVLTGAGKAFHAGGDLKRMRDQSGMFAGGAADLRDHYIAGIQTIPRRLALFDKPIVAAINGAAIGAGLDLACMCDIRIAARRARLGSTFVKVGLVPGDGGAYFLARTVGFPRALEMVLTGRVVDAEEAARIGLVHRVVDDDALGETARTTAATLAANAPVAMRLTKRAAYRSWDLDMDSALELASTFQGIAQTTADHQTAVRAILDKTEPTFDGR